MYQLLGRPILAPGSARMAWQARRHWPGDTEEGLRIGTMWHSKVSRRSAAKTAQAMLEECKVDWISFGRDDIWTVDCDRLREWVRVNAGSIYGAPAEGLLYDLPWLVGKATRRIEVEYQPQRTLSALSNPSEETFLWINICREEFELEKKTRIFLSHKGADKPMVRRFHAVLESLGHAPWLDEEDMAAGVELHRMIQKGMEESCAAVFFLTEEFKDERFLRGEINHAIAQKTERGDRFSIITLVFDRESENRIEVPLPLKPYVWKHPKSELDGLREIIRGLPVTLGPVRWK